MKKKLAALVDCNGKLLAIHNNEGPVHDYLVWLTKNVNPRLILECSIQRIPKSVLKKRDDYPELYLVRRGDNRFPASYCGAVSSIVNNEGYDYKQAIDTLFKLCEMQYFTKKELNAIATVIDLLQAEIDDIDECHYDPKTLYEINELTRAFENRINNDD